jgi:hypothetical protein
MAPGDHARAIGTNGSAVGIDLAEAVAAVRTVAAGAAPRLAAEATILRYRAYLHYLDTLADLYAKELKIVDLTAVRKSATGRRR